MKPNETKKNNWYVVYTYPNSEKKIYKELNKRDITTFLPIRKVVRQWSDRKKQIDIPLIPNYVFVKIPPNEMWMVLMIDGVVRFISFDGTPAVMKDSEMDMFRKLITGTNVVTNENFCVRGEKVQVKEGPLAGLVGKVLSKKGMTRLYVELETVNQIISVDIEAALLEKLE